MGKTVFTHISSPINQEIKRMLESIRKDGKLTKDQKLIQTLHGIKQYYTSSSHNINDYFDRLEYLQYKKNMQIGITSGVIAGIIFLMISWGSNAFAPILTESLMSTSNILFKILIYFFVIIILIIFVLLPCVFIIKMLIIYCFHTFFNGKQSYITNYEIEVIQDVLVKKTQSCPNRCRSLITGYQPHLSGLKKKRNSSLV